MLELAFIRTEIELVLTTSKKRVQVMKHSTEKQLIRIEEQEQYKVSSTEKAANSY